jgi:hypothetical protein
MTQIAPNTDYAGCLRGLETSRKIWEKYDDGQASEGDAKVNEERKKLKDAGFQASYWIHEASPGRSAEYWVNDASKKLKINYLGELQWKMGDEQ